jgi:hypothetical protein
VIGVRTFNIVVATVKIKNFGCSIESMNGQIVIDGVTGNIGLTAFTPAQFICTP